MHNTEKTTIGEELKNLRISFGFTQKEWIAETNLTKSTYSDIENNKIDIRTSDLLNLLTLHNIDINTFFDKVLPNYDKSKEKTQDTTLLSQNLSDAFYKNDFEKARTIKKQFLKLKNINSELKYHAILVEATTKKGIENLDSETINQIHRELFNNQNWVTNKDALRIFGNSMPTFKDNYDVLCLLMRKVLKEYRNIQKYSDEIKLRIGSICINFLFNSYTQGYNSTVNETFKLLNKLPHQPKYLVYKELAYYYKCLYAKSDENAAIIELAFKKSGFSAWAKKLHP